MRVHRAVPLIAALLGLSTEGRYPALDLTPQRQKQLTLAALVDQLDGLAATQPVLLAYEDMHWSDPTTQELLGLSIERLQRLPVLLLITYRPEFSPPWPSQPHVSALALSRLGRREGTALVGRVSSIGSRRSLSAGLPASMTRSRIRPLVARQGCRSGRQGPGRQRSGGRGSERRARRAHQNRARAIRRPGEIGARGRS